MRETLRIFCLIALTRLSYGQSSTFNDSISSYDWVDTTYHTILLSAKIEDTKIIAVEIGKKATIYLSKKLLRQSAARLEARMTDDFTKRDITKILRFIDSTSAINDTIIMSQNMSRLDYLISGELKSRYARVYYKKQKQFVATISHRLEKYGKYAHRFFYLPDRRPFFETMELAGILEPGKFFSDPRELEEVARKMSDLKNE